MEITTQNALEGWKSVLSYIFNHGAGLVDSNNRNSREVLNVVMRLATDKKITTPVDYLSKNEMWVYPTLREIEELILGKRTFSSYGYAYGERIFGSKNGRDYINSFIVPLLKKEPQTRRATLTLLKQGDESEAFSEHMPAIAAIDFKLRDNKLHGTMFIRSCDVFIGWPANIYQLAVLMRHVAEHLSVSVGTLTTILASAHIFEDYAAEIRRLLNAAER